MRTGFIQSVGGLNKTKRSSEKEFWLSNCLGAGTHWSSAAFGPGLRLKLSHRLPRVSSSWVADPARLSLRDHVSPFPINVYLSIHPFPVCMSAYIMFMSVFCVHMHTCSHFAHTHGRERPWERCGHAPAVPCRSEADDLSLPIGMTVRMTKGGEIMCSRPWNVAGATPALGHWAYTADRTSNLSYIFSLKKSAFIMLIYTGSPPHCCHSFCCSSWICLFAVLLGNSRHGWI